MGLEVDLRRCPIAQSLVRAIRVVEAEVPAQASPGLVHAITPVIVRRQAWWTAMAGGFFTYGQDQMWRVQEGWDKTFDTPGAGHVCKMREILTSLPWWEFTPDQSIFATGISSEQTLNTAMRSTGGDRVLVYLSSQCTVFVHLDKITTAQAKATLVNPTTGERRAADTYRTGNLNGRTFPDGQTQFFTTPGHWEGAVLLLEGVKESAK